MPFDVKKAQRALYVPSRTPSIVEVPAMNYLAVRGEGDPNEEGGLYQSALALLYGVAYTIKMAPKHGHPIDGYEAYVVPPLEGFWWMEGRAGVDYAHKEGFQWISCIRLPDFVTPEDVAWAREEATRKKKLDCTPVEFMALSEGLCAHCLHVGSFDSEPATVAALHAFVHEQGYETDFSDTRRHHEIYLSDPRRTAPERLRTVIRHPIRPRA